MTVKLKLNVWTIGVDTLPEIVSFKVDSDIDPLDVKDVVAENLPWPKSRFDLRRPSQRIELPPTRTWDSLQGLQQTPPENLTLDPLPVDWNAEEVFCNSSDLHLVAIERGAYKVNIFNTQSRKITHRDVPLVNRIETFCTSPFQPPSRLAYDTARARQATKDSLQSIDVTTLKEISSECTLLDLYPLGLSHAIHLIDAPASDEDEETEEEDVLAPLNVTGMRRKHFKAVPQKAPSSEAKGTPLTSAINQQLVGRLPEPLNAAPPSLFDETLCRLRHDIHHVEPLHEDYAAFYKLRSAMIATYSDESSRKRAFYRVAPDFLPGSPCGMEIYDYRTDGALFVDHEKHSFIYVIIEVKNEIGSAVAEPGVQAARYYLEHFRSLFEAKEDKLDHCTLPVILLCQFGPYLSVLVGSAGGSSPVPAVEQIACIALHADVTNLEEIKAGARTIRALRVASLALRERYPSLITDTQRQVQFPYPRSFRDENGDQVYFTYIRAEEDKRVYYGKCNDTGEPLCIKFSLRYSPEAHRVAFDAGYAPKLLAVEHVGDWHMVVMDDKSSDYTTLIALRATKGGSGRVGKIREEVQKALGIVHGQGFVHGDVRAVNVLVRKTESGKTMGPGSVLLVDWDWAGREGSVCYPHTLNTEIARHDGAAAGAMIERDHDIWMLDRF